MELYNTSPNYYARDGNFSGEIVLIRFLRRHVMWRRRRRHRFVLRYHAGIFISPSHTNTLSMGYAAVSVLLLD